jgi:hypothetical protein
MRDTMNFDIKGLDQMVYCTSSLSINLGLKNTFLLGFDYGFTFLDANGDKIGKLNDYSQLAIKAILNVVYENQIK